MLRKWSRSVFFVLYIVRNFDHRHVKLFQRDLEIMPRDFYEVMSRRDADKNRQVKGRRDAKKGTL